MGKEDILKTLDLVPYEDSKNESNPVEIQSTIDSDTIDADFDYARNNLVDIIEKGKDALNMLSDIADQSQHPKAYDSLSSLIGQMITAQDKLLDLHQKHKKLKDADDKKPNNVTNNLFVGSTAELQKLINRGKDE